MKKLRILSIRKNTDPYVEMLEKRYLKRLKPHFDVSIEDIRQKYSSELPHPVMLRQEAELFEGKLSGKETRILLDEDGHEMPSVEFSRWLDKLREHKKELVFLIGGPYGFDEMFKKRAEATLSLSRMTMTHEFARLFLLEQLYRSCDLSSGGSYHK